MNTKQLLVFGASALMLCLLSACNRTPTKQVQGQLVRLAEVDIPGVYHIVNRGNGASFAEFAAYALELASIDPKLVSAVTLGDLKLPAPRPRNSRLKCLVSEARGLDPMPFWRDAVREFVAQITSSNSASIQGRSV